MKVWVIFVFIVCFNADSFSQPDTTQHIIPGRVNSFEQTQKPYVILISIDGFRYDYAEKFDAVNIKSLSLNAVKAASMVPSYPSLTFPNHYTLVTGLYPSHHGLVGNYFYDRNRKESYSMKTGSIVKNGYWYGGTPLWVLAEEQHMLSASFYW
ncbi:MAG TPA: ectonucleotide pyrophosphatase/phosphodiesterase, partial [Ferruginibacter sp.]|nr:ectonucleotide pyrophosphatase/phosphodiesterase [Ferruginibacter sp.]